jgi:CHAD domain-containing protein
MSFEIDSRGDLRKQVRKAAAGQLDKALKALRPRSSSASSRDASVHNSRKRLKETRALLRLVRKGLGEKKFIRENTTLRDAARPLSEVRDATALLEALQSLQERYAGTVNKNTFKSARKALRRRRLSIRERILVKDKALTRSATVVKKVRNRAGEWDLQHGSWQVLQSGLHRAYKQGHRAMIDASKDSTDENLHEWRKRAKDLRYQLELLEPLWPEVMEATAEQAETLTDLLGDDHDLAVLRGLLDNELKETVTNEANETLKGLIDSRRADLQHSAMSLSEKLFAESPGQFVERIRTYWKSAA